MAVSGYVSRSKDFDDLFRILDTEIRLITPTDPEGVQSEDGVRQCVSPPSTSQRFYQLTHDYLVPSLREWLTRKQKETRCGRAELKLAERSALWNAKSENRYLPSLTEWFSIRTLTDSKHWTAPQREMMRRAQRLNLSRLVAVVTIVGLITAGGLWTWNRVDLHRLELLAEQEATRIEGLVGRLTSAEPAQVPEIVKGLDGNQVVASKYLLPLVSVDAKTVDEKHSQLHARLAMVSRDKSLVDPLLEELFTNKVACIAPIRQQLRPYAGELTEKLRAILRDETAETNRRFHAAVALADYVPASDDATWTVPDLRFVAEQLVSANAEFQPLLRENLRPVSRRLLADLEDIFSNASGDAQRVSAANAFVDYMGSDIEKLFELMMVATPKQYTVLYPIVALDPAPSTVDNLGEIAATPPLAEWGSDERIAYGQRRANAAITMLRLHERKKAVVDTEKVLQVFNMPDDPEALTQFIFRCRSCGVSVAALLDCLELVSRAPERYPRNARYALLLALGEFSLQEIPEVRRESLLDQLSHWYRQDPSSGVHGATGWLLRKWERTEVVRLVDRTSVPYSPEREWFTLAITVTPVASPKDTEKHDESGGSKPQSPEKRQTDPPLEQLEPKTFYYTFIVFPAGDSEIGSLSDELDRQKGEVRHIVTLARPFALLDREITFEELLAFEPTYYAGAMQKIEKSKPDHAGFYASWYDSVGFCRWLGKQSGLSEANQSYANPDSLNKERFPRDPDPTAQGAPLNWPLELDRQGFRLPTESEWEVASRAGAKTAYGFGSDKSLLGQFGWFVENSENHVHPPRRLRPSIRGLFDMHGNLYEWNHDRDGNYGVEAMTDSLGAREVSSRVFRGGWYGIGTAYCRSSFRFANVPTSRTFYYGFRIALSPSSKSVDVINDMNNEKK